MPPQFKLLLEEWAGNGELLLADGAYDAISNLFAKEKGFRPIIHPRSFEPHGFARRDMAVEFAGEGSLQDEIGDGGIFRRSCQPLPF